MGPYLEFLIEKVAKVVVMALMCAVLVGCIGAISSNMEDGYQAGDVSNGLTRDKEFYCSPPLRGIRAVGRFLIVILGGVTVPDVCAVIDAVVDSEAQE